MDTFIPNSIIAVENILKEAYSLGLNEGTKGEFHKKNRKTSRRNFSKDPVN